MKFSKLFKVSVLAAVLPINASLLIISMEKAEANGNFSQSCTITGFNAQDFSKTAVLTANCRRRDGSIHYGASINLNNYITNRFGNLKWQSGGDFEESCYQIGLESQGTPSPTFMSGFCYNENGYANGTSINLNENITNNNGNLQYVRP